MKKTIVALTLAISFSASALEQTCEAQLPSTSASANFTDNQDGTVTDKATKLTWMRCSIGQDFNADTLNCDGAPEVMFWQDALKNAEKARTAKDYKYYQFAGISNWRLPNIKELNTLRELACVNPAVNASIFPNIMHIAEASNGGYAYLWSSTPLAGDKGIMVMDLNGGSLSVTSSPTDYQRQILLVADPK